MSRSTTNRIQAKRSQASPSQASRTIWAMPRFRWAALALLERNFLVWKKLIGPAIVLNFGEPLIYLLGLGLGLGHLVGEVGGLPYLVFLASGVVASSAMTTVSFEGMYSVFTRMVPQKTYDAIMATPMDIDDIVLGESIWAALKGLLSAIAILIVAAVLGAVPGGWMAAWALPVVFLMGLAFVGPAIIMSAIAGSYDFFNYYFVLVVTPMFMLSGVFFPLDSMPHALQVGVQFLPLTHAIEIIRPLIVGQPVEHLVLHLAVLLFFALIGYFFAVAMVRRRLWV
ncbi:ABC transporter permease [Halothiobacillus sp.]|uniref:ABC transporter permease n=2 Tax=Halothiobacillus sp. TaxID=1891311 RepID=UPI002623A391|nr:ABC transporter permease [Halothiobacillus sp.]MDD4965338.1 ABC transporter permease [Halothiobacillus sp.]